MATYTPACFPRRPKHSTFFSEIRYQWQLFYYRYEVNTPLYVMSENEKLAFNLAVLSILLPLFFAIYWYLPGAVIFSLRRLGYYLTGSSAIRRATILEPIKIVDVFQDSLAHEAAASLAGTAMAAANASIPATLP